MKPVNTDREKRRLARGYGRLSLRLPKETLEQLDRLAKQLKQPRSRVINTLIRRTG